MTSRAIFPRAIHLEDAPRPRFDDHREAIRQSLERVDFDPFPVVAVAPAGIVLPHDLPILVELDDLAEVPLAEDVAVVEHPQVMQVPNGELPNEFPLGEIIPNRLAP